MSSSVENDDDELDQSSDCECSAMFCFLVLYCLFGLLLSKYICPELPSFKQVHVTLFVRRSPANAMSKLMSKYPTVVPIAPPV